MNESSISDPPKGPPPHERYDLFHLTLVTLLMG